MDATSEKGGALREHSTGGKKAGFCVLACAALLVLPPMLLNKEKPSGHASPQARHVALKRVSFRIAVPTTAPATTQPPVTAPAPTLPPVTAPPTTLPYVPPTTTTMPVRALGHNKEGEATWYGTGTGTGYCASPYLPRGTIAYVTNTANGKSIHCMVSDSQVGSPSNRIIDLAPADFSVLAGSTNAGVIQVTVSW